MSDFTYARQVKAWQQRLVTERRMVARQQGVLSASPPRESKRTLPAVSMQSPKACTPSPSRDYLRPASSSTSLPTLPPRSLSEPFLPVLSRSSSKASTTAPLSAWLEAPLVFQNSNAWNEPPRVFSKYVNLTSSSTAKPPFPLLRWREGIIGGK